MNTPTTAQPTPDLESLHKAVQEFRPSPHRIPFNNLKPFHDYIAILRAKQASYSVVAELLQRNGVKTSRARVAEYGRIVLDGGKSHKRRKRVKPAPAVASTILPIAAPANNVPPLVEKHSLYTSEGPRIAKIAMMSPEQLKEFNASYPPGKTSTP